MISSYKFWVELKRFWQSCSVRYTARGCHTTANSRHVVDVFFFEVHWHPLAFATAVPNLKVNTTYIGCPRQGIMNLIYVDQEAETG